jgi:hypothetical protein
MDSAENHFGPADHTFCLDLNDNLFVPGDTIYFFFGATSAAPGGKINYWSPFTGTTFTMNAALDEPGECTILPTPGRNILYVDDFDGLGAQPFFDTAFSAIGLGDNVDRYDVRGPDKHMGNGPGARVVDVTQQLVPAYHTIVWNSGDVYPGSITNGAYNDKSDDAGMLLAFLDGLESPGGVFISGDNVAGELTEQYGSALALRSSYIEYSIYDNNHVDRGLRTWPAVIGETGSPYVHGTSPDTTLAFSPCPDYPAFDIMLPVGASARWLRYDGAAPDLNGAAIGQSTTNPNGQTVTVALWGFSFHTIRDDRPTVPIDRFDMLSHTLQAIGANPAMPLPATSPYVNALAQNVPNPFNPTTTIAFSIKERAPVTLTIYNVRGQRVKTLVTDTRAPGVTYRIQWDGRNDAGQQVASGVYFYRLVTKGFTKTKKMVHLK